VSGWIKFEKDLLTDPRTLRIAGILKRRDCNASPLPGVTVVLGGLAQLWMIADTHIRNDDVLPLGVDEINEVIGVQGFCELLPTDWLQVIDPHHVKLPEYHAHNGTIAKERALNAKRVERHRKHSNGKPLHVGNGKTLPDLDLDQDKTKTLRTPPTPLAGGRVSRDVRTRSKEAWTHATKAIDNVNGTKGTWDDVAMELADQNSLDAIEAAGGCRAIADRDRFTRADIESRFREAYEAAL
jgi:hypothetical protein